MPKGGFQPRPQDSQVTFESENRVLDCQELPNPPRIRPFQESVFGCLQTKATVQRPLLR